jgi:hypothetical protein
MTIEEARIIYRSWQNYMEISDKFHCLMLPVPESFLPYPADTLEEALNIIAKQFFDSGDKETSEEIKESMSLFLLPFSNFNEKGGVTSDGEAITSMKKMLDLIEQSPELKKALLEKLKESQNSWIKSRSRKWNG